MGTVLIIILAVYLSISLIGTFIKEVYPEVENEKWFKIFKFFK